MESPTCPNCQGIAFSLIITPTGFACARCIPAAPAQGSELEVDQPNPSRLTQPARIKIKDR